MRKDRGTKDYLAEWNAAEDHPDGFPKKLVPWTRQPTRNPEVLRFWGIPHTENPPDTPFEWDDDDFPSGIAQAEMKYTDLLDRHAPKQLSVNAGIVAVVQNEETLAVEPVLSWAVMDHGKWPGPGEEEPEAVQEADDEEAGEKEAGEEG